MQPNWDICCPYLGHWWENKDHQAWNLEKPEIKYFYFLAVSLSENDVVDLKTQLCELISLLKCFFSFCFCYNSVWEKNNAQFISRIKRTLSFPWVIPTPFIPPPCLFSLSPLILLRCTDSPFMFASSTLTQKVNEQRAQVHSILL